MVHHLSTSYGDRAPLVIRMAQEHGLGRRLHPSHPIIEAEVAYSVQVGLIRTR